MGIRIGKGSHWKGPLLGNDKATSGLFEGVALGFVDRIRSPYQSFIETFEGVQSDVDFAAVGWTVTAVTGATGAPSIVYNQGTASALIVNAGTTADEGYNLQFNAAPAATGLSAPERLMPSMASTATRMTGRELIWSTRIAFALGNGTTFDSKAFLGIAVADTALLSPTDGTLDLATGGGIGFHINGDTGGDNGVGLIRAVMQGTTVATSTSTGVSVTGVGFPANYATATAINWIDLGFRARWTGTGTGVVDFYVNGRKAVSYNGATVPLPFQSTQSYANSIFLANGPATADQVDMAVNYMFNAVTYPGIVYPYTTDGPVI